MSFVSHKTYFIAFCHMKYLHFFFLILVTAVKKYVSCLEIIYFIIGRIFATASCKCEGFITAYMKWKMVGRRRDDLDVDDLPPLFYAHFSVTSPDCNLRMKIYFRTKIPKVCL